MASCVISASSLLSSKFDTGSSEFSKASQRANILSSSGTFQVMLVGIRERISVKLEMD